MNGSRVSNVLTVLVCALALTGAAWAGQGPDPDRYIVKFTNPSQGKAALAGAGAAILRDLPEVNAAAARIPAHALQALAANPNIEYIERDVPRYPLAQTSPYGIGMVQADQVSDAGAANRTVCIIDSGYSLGHEDLDGDASIQGTNDSGTGNWFVDNCAHGTHVAGTISALNNGVGVLGVLPGGNVNLHIVKVFGDSCAWAYSSDLVAAAFTCRDNGANVISMSLGCNGNLCRSTTEENAFNSLYNNNGILSVAAAGNSGNTQLSYPASYDSVVSVAAVDSAKLVATFSQQNSQVELAAPGVAVRSTVPMGTGSEESLSVGTTGYEVVGMDGSPNATGTGPLVDCGIGTSACPGGGGQVCLIQRGTISFAEKVQACEAGGGAAAVIYNNADALFSGTLGTTVTGIPSVGTAGTTGATLLTLLGQSATVTTGPGNYAFFDGTSMATPHTSAVAALVWSHDTTWTNQQIRDALAATAEDLGAGGRDNAYGHGLIQAKAALDHLQGAPPPPPPGGIVLAAVGYKVKGVKTADLTWTGATSTNVDVRRDGVLVVTTPNDGFHTDSTGQKGGGSHTYQVCEAGTTTCSNTVNVSF
jgi:subtilisin family serine protease